MRPLLPRTERRAIVGRRYIETTTIHEGPRHLGERTIRRVWLDDAPSIAGGWPAGTATEERVRGNHLAGNLEVLVPQHEVEREAHQ